jgi:hypothetical protein
MEITVKEVSTKETSAAEREEKVLTEAQKEEAGKEGVETKTDEAPPEKSVTEKDVLEFIKAQKNQEYSSIDEILTPKEIIKEPELPEDVSKYLEYRKETGRSYRDFLAFQESFEDKSEDERLSQYLLATEKGLDAEDVQVMMDEFSYDEDIDDDDHIKKVKLKKKKVIAKAKEWFDQNKEKYGTKGESSGVSIPEAEKEQYEAYKQYVESAKTETEAIERKREVFTQKTDEVFSQDFKGFEFQVGDKKVLFSPGNAEDVKKLQTDTSSFVSKFLDENGMIKDAAGYHKSLSAALNPDKLAKFFYDQGVADAVEKNMRNIKNIDMSPGQARQVAGSNGFSVRAVETPGGDGSFKVKAKN